MVCYIVDFITESEGLGAIFTKYQQYCLTHPKIKKKRGAAK